VAEAAAALGTTAAGIKLRTHKACRKLRAALGPTLAAAWTWPLAPATGPLAAPAQSAGSRPPEKTTAALRACGAERLAV